ncbi:MAG: ComF family protein [Lachnospiraceae bacterium]|nr:ComF family protein [Lachnospiraceae bacterium]
MDLLYPPRCPVCGGIAAKGERVCPACREKLPRIEGPRCVKCSKPVEDGVLLCDDCRGKDHAYDCGFAAFLYDDVMREIISDCKYRGRREYCRTLGVLLFEVSGQFISGRRPDVIVPVPLHPHRLAKRTFNQAEEIAASFGLMAQIAVEPRLLWRVQETGAMKKLSAGERTGNLRGAFLVPDGEEVPERVLLVDDIYTTGNTVDAAAHALKERGARRVDFLTVCIGSGFMVRY